MGAELDDVEGVQDGDGVGQLVAQCVGVGAEWVQRGVLDAGDERLGLRLQPAGVGVAGAARDDVKKAGVQASVLVAGQVHHRSRGAVAVPDPRGAPDVFVHADRAYPFQAGRVAQPALRFDLDGVPTRVPVHPQMTSHGGHGGVVLGQRAGRPSDRPSRQLRPEVPRVSRTATK